jgi:hypothetical protein
MDSVGSEQEVDEVFQSGDEANPGRLCGATDTPVETHWTRILFCDFLSSKRGLR